jgi:4-hydroxy-tetrahydrodipicolinate synthase
MSIGRVRKALGGISGILVTLYLPHGSLNEPLLARLARTLTEAGIHNLVSGGNTGEFFSLTFDEIVGLQAVTLAAMDGASTLRTAAVGRSLNEALATGRRAISADGEPDVAPPARSLRGAAGAGRLLHRDRRGLDRPHRPDGRDPAREMGRVAAHPNIAGIKFATPNLLHMADCMRAAGDRPRSGSAVSPRAGRRRSAAQGPRGSRLATSTSIRRDRWPSGPRSRRAASRRRGR